MFKFDGVVEDWHKKLAKMGNIRFAHIRTIRAIYDKVAIISDSSGSIFVEYPRSHFVGKNIFWKIIRKSFPKKEIVSGYYYL